jgi:hypothetical protein
VPRGLAVTDLITDADRVCRHLDVVIFNPPEAVPVGDRMLSESVPSRSNIASLHSGMIEFALPLQHCQRSSSHR